jgi:hypothetical protein
LGGLSLLILNSRKLHHLLRVRTVKESDLIPATEAGDRKGGDRPIPTATTARATHPPARAPLFRLPTYYTSAVRAVGFGFAKPV